MTTTPKLTPKPASLAWGDTLTEISTKDEWTEELNEIFDAADNINELIDELDEIAEGRTTHESEHYSGTLDAFIEDMDEEDLYDLGQKDGEIRLARRLLKIWRGDNV